MNSDHRNRPPGSAFQADTSIARQHIFERIRNAQKSGPQAAHTGGVSAGDSRADTGNPLEAARRRMNSTERGPQPLPLADPLAVFIEQALALSCTVDRVSAPAGVAAAIADYLLGQSLPLNAVAWPSLSSETWLGDLASRGVAVRLGAPQGDDPVGISAVACAVAETGTLVLRSSPETPASTHLLPETHVAVLRVADIVPTLEDAFARMRPQGEPLPRALNLVSGPSRTGDIEQTIVLGAHGPYRVHLVIIDQAG